MASPVQRWSLVAEGRLHDLEIEPAGLARSVRWQVDGREVAAVRSGQDRLVLRPGADERHSNGEQRDADQEELGAVALRFLTWSGTARRVSWFAPGSRGGAEAAAQIGVGGLDFVPEHGSRAARRGEWISAHPRRFVVSQTLLALVSVVLPVLLALLAVRWAVSLPWPSIPWPDWDLPSIPLPRISLPTLDLPSLPGWVTAVLSKAKYVWPVALAFVLARAEVRRRNAARDEGHTDEPGPGH